jgi:Zn finger protein HypA/HybF involved in hydrogenase expression
VNIRVLILFFILCLIFYGAYQTVAKDIEKKLWERRADKEVRRQLRQRRDDSTIEGILGRLTQQQRRQPQLFDPVKLDRKYRELDEAVRYQITIRNFSKIYELFHEYVDDFIFVHAWIPDTQKKRIIKEVKQLNNTYEFLLADARRKKDYSDLRRYIETQFLGRMQTISRTVTSTPEPIHQGALTRREESTELIYEADTDKEQPLLDTLAEREEREARSQLALAEAFVDDDLEEGWIRCPNCESLVDPTPNRLQDARIECPSCGTFFFEHVKPPEKEVSEVIEDTGQPSFRIISDTIDLDPSKMTKGIALIINSWLGLGTCVICRKDIKDKSKVIACPKCESVGHYAHFHEWIRTKQKCPMCKNKLQVIIND